MDTVSLYKSLGEIESDSNSDRLRVLVSEHIPTADFDQDIWDWVMSPKIYVLKDTNISKISLHYPNILISVESKVLL
ncbi:hypothetical protein AYI68_g7544 [Smittium mucronatum]|uniref:Uncharacterized protein n=1 Tax=Smittium mucronatum TaxID=133383 RepID=A0A1R0GNF3_9FUNG|nr:hypothetical protein AYI68_g7544 [Smittium mucronatum]